MIELLKPTFDWIKHDYTSNKFRFCVELFAWAISIGCSITMATLYGLSAVVCMLGLLLLANLLACWLTTCYW